MPKTPDRMPGPSIEEETQYEDRTADGDPAVVGAVRFLNDDLRIRLSGGVFSLLDTLWQLVSGYLQPVTDGQGIRLYDTTGTEWATLIRSAGNFAISVGGSGANAFYKNTPKEITQLSGSDQTVYAHVQNGGDAACHTIYGDRTTKLYGTQRHTNAGSATEYMDIGRDGTQGYIQVAGGTELIQLTQKILEARLNGSSTAEMFRVVSDLGDVMRAFGDRTARFYGNNTHEGHILPDANNVRDIGSTSARWRSGHFQTEVRISSGGFSYTRLHNSSLTTVNSRLSLVGGLGWRARISNVLGDSIFQFVGNAATRKGRPRAYYGTGSGSTWTDISHDGTDGALTAGSGHLRVLANERSIVVPSAAIDPPSTVDGGIWHNTADDKFRGALNGVTRDFSMEFPSAATDPTSGMVDGDTYYNTTLKKRMTYDGSRSKWLSEDSVTLAFGRSVDTAAGTYYCGVNGLLLSATNGYPALHDGTIVAMGYTRNDTDAATFAAMASGTEIATLASSAVLGKDTTLNADFSEDDVLAVMNQAGGNTTTAVQVWIAIKWRV